MTAEKTSAIEKNTIFFMTVLPLKTLIINNYNNSNVNYYLYHIEYVMVFIILIYKKLDISAGVNIFH